MKVRSVLVAMFTVFALLMGPLGAMGADQTEKLIEILIQKGIITREDVKSLEKEIQKEETKVKEATRTKEETKTVEAAPPKEDWIKKIEWIKNIEVGYKQGAYIKTTDDRFSLKLNVNLQGLYNYDLLEGESDKTTFRVRRARLIPSGNAFYPWLKYYVQLTLEDSVNLRDAYIEATYFKWLSPRFGQYKVPFDREFLTSAFNLQLIDRSLANAEFSLQRDIGLQISGQPIGDLLEYRLGVFNGSGANKTNVDKDYMYIGRLVLTPFGPVPYSQGAVGKPDKPLLAVGVAGAYLPSLNPGERTSLAGRLGSTQVVSKRSDVLQFASDLAFQYQNFSFEGGYYYRTIDPKEPTNFGKEDAYGYFLQGGYFLIPKKFEVAARYSYMNPDNPNQIDNNRKKEITGGLSYYFAGHPLKIQGNYSFFKSEATPKDRDEHLIQGQLSLAF
jgi:polyhydroxyalkanoate synthesis regulator phasin